MKIIKLVFTLVLLAVLAGGGFYVLSNRGVIPPDQAAAVQNTVQGIVKGSQIENLTQQISQPITNLTRGTNALPKLPSQVPSANQVSEALQQAPELASSSENNGSVLGSSVQAEQPPLGQRAFEYGRYLYCQEVVKDYENRFPQE